MPTDEHEERSDTTPASSAEERLSALLAALAELRQYLDERGTHTYELAQRFIANARRDPSSRAYDERQATMLEYQHYIWREIAGRVGQIIALYGDASTPGEGETSASPEAAPSSDMDGQTTGEE